MLRSVERSRANSRAEAKCFGAEFFCKLQLWSRIRLCPLPVRIHIIIVMSALIIIGYRSEWVCRAVLDPSKPEESLLWHPETAVAGSRWKKRERKKIKAKQKSKKTCVNLRIKSFVKRSSSCSYLSANCSLSFFKFWMRFSNMFEMYWKEKQYKLKA